MDVQIRYMLGSLPVNSGFSNNNYYHYDLELFLDIIVL